MISVTVSTKQLQDQYVDAAIVFVEQGIFLEKQIPHILKISKNCPKIAEKRKFDGAALDIMVLPMHYDEQNVHYYILVGIGSKESLSIEKYRRAVGKAIRTAISLHCSSVAVELPSANMFGQSVEYVAEQTTIISLMATYHFDEFITQEDRKETPLTSIVLCAGAKEKSAVQKGIKEGEVIAHSVNKARHWVDSPPLHLTPEYLAQKAKDIAKEQGLTVTVFDEKQIVKMGMGGLAAVSRGSDIDCQLVVLEYHAPKKNAPTVAFVGKGITFDSGGLSLKPAQSMETMKEDMSGAAAVIAAFEVLAQLKPNINIIGITPLSENLPSGKATKPGDIIRFYNGKTAEIKNTDAEGRLILADALSYAVKHYKPDAIIDLATLTGACAYALGPFYSGLMSQHDKLVEKINKAAELSGDQVWRLPMGDDYKKAIKSDVADICNIGDGRIKAGAITAAHFLQHFVEDIPWAHLDIAGTAFDVPNISYYRSGATGVGVRLLVALAMNWK